MKTYKALTALLLFATMLCAIFADTVSFLPEKDNTIYLDLNGQLSNGQGIYLFAGRTNNDALRRGLVAFDLTSIPTDATITGASFSMFLNRPRPNTARVNVSLSRALRNWGEGASNAGEPGGIGAQAETNDATWLHTFYDTGFWTTAGGDFSSTPSTTTAVMENAIYTWSGSGLLADVQSWVSNPATNFGWFILGAEMDTGTAQRFNTRENTSDPPRLTVTYQVTPTPTPTATPGSLGNISTRLRVLVGDNVLIGGLIVMGTQGKRVILRAIGPTLSDFGVPGALGNPTLELYQGNTLLFSNDDWRNSTQQAEIASSGFAPNNDAESAIIWTLMPGRNYTMIMQGKNGITGVGLVEVFDLDQGVASKFANISARGLVDVDDNVMIAGLIVTPTNGASLRIVARALGPTLTDFGVTGVLGDPTLDLINSNGMVIRSNNNWKDSQRAEIEATGLAPNHDEEAALVEMVAPGGYTVIVRGDGRTTGLGLVEVYNIP